MWMMPSTLMRLKRQQLQQLRQQQYVLERLIVNRLQRRRNISSSIGFSGAGFLIAYHLGVAACLSDQLISLSAAATSTKTYLQQQQSETNDRNRIRLTGVSSGSIIAAAILANVDPETDGIQTVYDIYTRVQQQTSNSLFNTLQPGFSLIDIVEEIFTKLLLTSISNHFNDGAEFIQIINQQQLLRIGLTDRRIFPPIGYNPNAYVYIDTYRSVQDIISACILSSYIPGITGPLLGNFAMQHHAIARASQQIHEMIEAGCVKKGTTGEPVQLSMDYMKPSRSSSSSCEQQQQNQREIYWDGGLVNAFPRIDSNTVIVSPIAADFSYNKDSISPALEYRNVNNNTRNSRNVNTTSTSGIIPKVVLNPNVTIHLTKDTLNSLRYMILTNATGSNNADNSTGRNQSLQRLHQYYPELNTDQWNENPSDYATANSRDSSSSS